MSRLPLSRLSNELFERAEEIKNENNVECVSGVCFLAAVSEFCLKAYRGITDYDLCEYPENFEEERLRLVRDKVMKFQPSLSRMLFTSRARGLITKYDIDFLQVYAPELNKIMEVRSKNMISADVIFLVALKSIAKIDIGSALNCDYGFSVLEMLEEVDACVYSYTLSQLNKVNEILINKAKRVIELRDWVPAAKIAEPDDVKQLFLECVHNRFLKNRWDMTVPEFFGFTKGDITLSIVRSDEVFYVHDNGLTMKVLENNCDDAALKDKILYTIRKYIPLDEKGRLIGSFCQLNGLFLYMQQLMLIANSDLYYKRFDPQSGFRIDVETFYPSEDKCENFDFEEVFKTFGQHFQVRYDQNKGVIMTIDTRYAMNEERPAFLFEKVSDGVCCLSDAQKGKVGEIFESFYFNCDSLKDHFDFLKNIPERFGIKFDGESLTHTFKYTDKKWLFNEWLKFYNAAVILAEFGRMIDVQ